MSHLDDLNARLANANALALELFLDILIREGADNEDDVQRARAIKTSYRNIRTDFIGSEEA